MKAAVQDRYGPPEVVRIADIETPVPADDQVLVRVRAASVNRADLDGLTPRPSFARLFMGLRAPRNHRVGIDVAGVVEAVGATASRFRPGDAVFADMFAFGQGTFAEYVCARERAFQPMPPGISFEDAATLPHSAILALQGLRLRNGRTIGPGDRVLIDGASGNVGPFAVQIAKSRGAEVTGVLKPKSVYVTLGGTSLPIFGALIVGPLISMVSDTWTGLLIWWKPFNPDAVATLKELIAAGKVKPIIDRRFPLSEVVDALRWVHDGHAKGKVVITG